MTVRLSLGGHGHVPASDIYFVQVEIRANNDEVRTIEVHYDHMTLMSFGDKKYVGNDWYEQVGPAVALFSVETVSSQIEHGLLDADANSIRIEDEQIGRWRRRNVLRGEKPCEFRTEASGRRVVCDVGSRPKTGESCPIPTTENICAKQCVLPSQLNLCAGVVNVEVTEIYQETMGRSAPVRQRTVQASCSDGQPIDRTDEHGVGRCVPGGRMCWHRVVPRRQPATTEQHPLSLHEAVDFLDLVWLQRFGSSLIKVMPLADVALLATDPKGKDEVSARMSVLKFVLDSFHVDSSTYQGWTVPSQRRNWPFCAGVSPSMVA